MAKKDKSVDSVGTEPTVEEMPVGSVPEAIPTEPKESAPAEHEEESFTFVTSDAIATLVAAGCWHQHPGTVGWFLSAPFSYRGLTGQWTAAPLGPMPLAEAIDVERIRPK